MTWKLLENGVRFFEKGTLGYACEEIIAVDPIPFPVCGSSMEKLAHHRKMSNLPGYDWRTYNERWEEHQAYERGKEVLKPA